jgi:hypothetical protein
MPGKKLATRNTATLRIRMLINIDIFSFFITHMGLKPTTNNETKDSNNSGLKWAPQALRPLVSCILSLVSYKQPWADPTYQLPGIAHNND